MQNRTDPIYLILEDGTVFTGKSFGAIGDITGEIVFTTGMTGYLETLTDPSYYGQIILQTFPLIGNYGVIPADFENPSVKARAYIVKHPCQEPSNFRSEGDLDTFLREQGVVGLYGIDTRALTKIIRKKGVMNGKITTSYPTDSDRAQAEEYTVKDAVASVSSDTVCKTEGGSRRVALLDYGAKRGIRESLSARDCEVWSFPHDTNAKDVLAIKPNGIMLSNGPGDPAEAANAPLVDNIRELMQSGVPIFGICLGHQLMALANGYKTEKLKFGHRGANQPVGVLASPLGRGVTPGRDGEGGMAINNEQLTVDSYGNIFITSQNHGYAVIADSSDAGSVSFVNVNDGTCEGIEYGNSFSVQFHPEACGGPLDTAFLFDRFIERMDEYAARQKH
ncbi:MAG: carbamoyl phosphate synthase small subunit [Oscillospiraceae bacterium]|nr:carbamoyl phosphate synthase small subunit [Oscillospiraceae bacterium]